MTAFSDQQKTDVKPHSLGRRRFLALSAAASASLMLMGCTGRALRGSASTAEQLPDGSPPGTEAGVESGSADPVEVVTTDTELRVSGSGPVEIEVWFHDWEGVNSLLQRVAETFSAVHDDATVVLRAIAYSDLYSGLLSAIAAGDEGDLLMMYTNWVIGSDITQVFLDVA